MADQLLLLLLAKIDAIFWPARYHVTPWRNISAIFLAREIYHRAGVRIVGGDGAKERQLHHRKLRALERAGLVKITGHTNNCRLRLTEAGDAQLRSATPNYRVDEAWPMFERIALLAEHALHAVLENDIHDPGASSIAMPVANGIADRALPLLARGWLESNSDVKGRIGYHLTQAGLKALAAGCPKPPACASPNIAAEDDDFYCERLADELRERSAWEADTRFVVIPLSAGLWRRPSAKMREKVLAHAKTI